MKCKINIFVKYIFLVLPVGALISCGGDKTPELVIPEPPTTKLFEGLDGVWQQQGYGFIYEIKDSNYIRYEYSSAHCLISEKGSLIDLSKIMKSVDKVENGEQFTFVTHYTLTKFYLDKQNELPNICNSTSNGVSTSPTINFEAFWHTFNEQYAFFEVREMDWLEQYQIYSPQINSNTSEEELFNLMLAMVKPLNDAHTRLSNGVKDESALTSQVPLIADFENQKQFSTLGEYLNHLTSSFHQTINNYLGESQKFAGNNKINWGKLSDTIGYLGIEDMADFSNCVFALMLITCSHRS